MDVETWNATVAQMHAASRRSVAMMEISQALSARGRDRGTLPDPALHALAARADELGDGALATTLHTLAAHPDADTAAALARLATEAFRKAAFAQDHAGELMRRLKEARAAGEEPDDTF